MRKPFLTVYLDPALLQALEAVDLQVQAVEPREINGGSLRLVVQHKKRRRVPQPSVVVKPATAPIAT